MTSTKVTDQIHRFIFDDADIRGEIATLSTSYQKACKHQALPPTAKVQLGEFLAAASLLSEVLKFTGTITIQARGNGLIPLIMADTTESGDLRGIVKIAPDTQPEQLEGLNLVQLIGDGVLTLTMDPEKGQRYQGIVELAGETLSECLTTYFTQSEQLPTRLWLFADLEHCGGLLLQALPKQKAQEQSSTLEHWATAEQLAKTATAEELFKLDHPSLLGRLFNDEFTVRVFDPSPIQFTCHCSHERCANTLSSLGEEDAFNLLKEQGLIEINCEFCGTQYSFDKDHLTTLFKQLAAKRQELH